MSVLTFPSDHSTAGAALARFAINHATVGFHVPAHTFFKAASSAGAVAVGLWQDYLDDQTPREIRRMLGDHGLSVTALNRGGFFATSDAQMRSKSLDATKEALDFCAEVGSPTLLIVPGGPDDHDKDLTSCRKRVEDGLSELSSFAADRNVSLGLEPFNPIYTRDKGVVNTLGSALDIADQVGPSVSVILDVYHLWWDPDRTKQIERAQGRISGYHVCDFKAAPQHPISDRALMGDGIAEVGAITGEVLNTGYDGYVEVEVFSETLWAMAPDEAISLAKSKYLSDTFPSSI